MRKKAFILSITTLLIILHIPKLSFANAGTVTFMDADKNSVIYEFDNTENLCAKVDFTVPEELKVNVITAKYNDLDMLIGEPIIETLTYQDVDKGIKTSHTTTPLSLSNAETVKVFVWTADNMKPVLTKTGILNKDFQAIDRYSVMFENTDSYIYRVGNLNTIKLSSLFSAIETDVPVSNIQAEITNVTGNANGTFSANANWGESTIKFSGTGIVELTICDDYSNPVSLLLEIVNGKNVTKYSEMSSTGNIVMLNDINIDSGAQFKLNNSTLYGNGFTFDVSDGTFISKNDLSNYLIQLNSSILDNVKIIGAVYTTYGETASTNYNNCVVLSTGNSTIANSYISNCAAPVRVHNGNINIINTTLKGGNFSNLDIRNGNVTLENVTTINQADLNDKSTDGKTVVGLGVTVYYEYADSATKINIKGNFTQYNHLSQNEEEHVIPSRLQSMFDAIFRYDDLVYTDENDIEWISTGILSMSTQVTDDNISDVDGYLDESPTAFGSTGYLHAPSKKAPAVAPEYVTDGQYTIAPTYKFDYTTKNYIPKATGSNDFCYYSNRAVMISFDDGESFEWDTSILTAQKSGKILPYTVTMNGVDYTGKKITFDEPGDYTVTYTYTDHLNYDIGQNNNFTLFNKTYTKNVNINVIEVLPDVKNAEFTFGSSNIPSVFLTIGNDTYVMPNDTSLSSTTISGQKIYYPTVEMFTSDGKWEHSSLNYWYACFPVFKDAITITDYSSNGEAVVYDESTTVLPAGLSVPGDPTIVFKYGATATAPSEPSIKNSILCYTSSQLSNNARGETNVLAKYQYTDNAGATYFYYINYHCGPVTVKETSCVTGDTLVTLADGAKKRVDSLTYDDEVLTWDFYNGIYTTAPVSLIINHGYNESEIINLFFDDGTKINLVNVHGMFNKTLNEFVDIGSHNVKDFVGDIFYKLTDNGFSEVKLVDYEITNEYSSSYSLLSAYHYNVILNDMLTASPSLFVDNLYEPFEIGEDMKYDEEKMKEDIQKYGFSEYEEFSEYLTKEQFEMLRVANAKILIGKGYATYESIIEMLKSFAIPYV